MTSVSYTRLEDEETVVGTEDNSSSVKGLTAITISGSSLEKQKGRCIAVGRVQAMEIL